MGVQGFSFFFDFFLLAAGEPRWGCKAFRFSSPLFFLRPASPDGGDTKGSQLAAKSLLKAKQQKRSTGPSRVVPHRSTTPARTSLTSLFGWEAVSLVAMAALTGRLAIHILKALQRHSHHVIDAGQAAGARPAAERKRWVGSTGRCFRPPGLRQNSSLPRCSRCVDCRP